MIDREQLAKRTDALNAEAAARIRLPETEIQQLATPFLARGAIYRVNGRPPGRPIIYTIGVADPDFAVLLANNPEGFFKLAARAGFNLSTDSNRIAYVTTFLETTRDFRRGFQTLKSFDDIHLLNKPAAADQQRYDDLRTKYQPVIRPPAISKNDPWVVNVFAVRSRNLVGIQARIQPGGVIEIAEKVLEEAIPVPYTR